MTAGTMAAAAAPTVEIRVRQRGARRQAFWRAPGRNWHTLPVPAADKAKRLGVVTVEGFREAPCVFIAEDDAANVPRETQHPAAGAFSALARNLNREIDQITASARGAA